MNLAHFHTPKIIPIYTQGCSNEFNVSVMKQGMYQREFRRWQVCVRGSGGMLPREIFEKSLHLGAFWHIFMQFKFFQKASFFQQAKS